MSQIKAVVLVMFAVALLAPAAQAGSGVRAVVRFAPAVAKPQQVSTVRAAGGRVLKVRRSAVVTRISVGAASRLRTAMGVISVRY